MSLATESSTETTTAGTYADLARATRERPTYPVPEVAKGPGVPPEGYVLDEIADGIFWLGDASYQNMFVVGDEGVIAVDAPPTLGNNILRAIDRVTKKPITHVVYSHHHSDHRGAMSIYPESATRYAHRATAQRLVVADPTPRVAVRRHRWPRPRARRSAQHPWFLRARRHREVRHHRRRAPIPHSPTAQEAAMRPDIRGRMGTHPARDTRTVTAPQERNEVP